METNLLPVGIIPNELLAQEYKWTAQEINLMLRVITEIRMRTLAPNYRIPKRELAVLMGESGNKYQYLRKAIISLIKKPMEYWNKETGKITICPLITYAELYPGESSVLIGVHPDLAKWIKETQANYTEFELSSIVRLSGKYSKLLYLKAKQWKFTGSYFATVDQLRELFGIGAKYEDWQNFKRKVIQPAIDEINEITDLHIALNMVKNGREITTTEFSVKFKKDIADLQHSDHLRKVMESSGLASWQCDNILATLPRDVIGKKIHDFQCNRIHIKNPGAYLNSVFVNLGVPMSTKMRIQHSIPYAS